jgi:serine/threonine protein kinase
MRWSAIEVLKENKFSKASDVWSFGVLIFEVMSRGALPYSEFATLDEVAAQIKRGCVQLWKPPPPPSLPAHVFERLNAPARGVVHTRI